MPNFPLNIVTKSDTAKLAEIHQQSFDKGWSVEDIESYLNRETCFGIWFEPVGFILFEIVEKECEIKTLAILPKHRRQKLAEILCNEMGHLCAELDVYKIFLEVSEKNEPAKKLYTKLGYKEFNRRKDYYGKGEDALLLQLQL